MESSSAFRPPHAGGGSLCVVPGVMELHVPIQTEYLGSLPGGGELFSVVAIVIALASAGRWAHHRLAATSGFAVTDPDEVAEDSDALWEEFDKGHEPTGV